MWASLLKESLSLELEPAPTPLGCSVKGEAPVTRTAVMLFDINGNPVKYPGTENYVFFKHRDENRENAIKYISYPINLFFLIYIKLYFILRNLYNFLLL